MSTLNRFSRALNKFLYEFNKPEGFVKGEEFEEYVRKYTFPRASYDLLHRTPQFSAFRNDFNESCLLPDYKFRDLRTNQEFFVECKFRSGYLNEEEKLVWCSDEQLKRYQEIDRSECPVFVVLGVGDRGRKPMGIFLFGISEINWTGLYPSFLNKHDFYLEKPVFSSHLWKHYSNANTVGQQNPGSDFGGSSMRAVSG